MTEYHATILKMSIHCPSENPIFGEYVTHIAIDDEAAGPFLVLTQSNPKQHNEIRLTLEELKKIAEVAREMVSQYPTEA